MTDDSLPDPGDQEPECVYPDPEWVATLSEAEQAELWAAMRDAHEDER